MTLNLFIYLFISCISLFTGLLYFKDKSKSLLIFLFIALVLPTSNQHMFLTSYQGVYFYDYYFLALIIYYIINIDFTKLKNSILNNKLILFITTSLLLYYTSLIYLNTIPFDKYLLRDFRPFLLLLSALIFIELLKNIRTKLDLILNILFYAFILKLLFFVIVFLIDPFEDPYYQIHLFRYRDGTTFVAALFLIIFLFKKQDMLVKISKIKLNIIVLLSMLILIISNLRILLPALLFVYFIVHKTNLDNLFRKVMLTVILISTFIGYTYVMPLIQYNLHEKEKTILRIKNLEDKKISKVRIDKEKSKLSKGSTNKRYNSLFKGIIQSLDDRFSPAMPNIKSMTNLELFLGQGFATTFEIPWFKYRGLDPQHNQIDSTYITFFVKYGVVGLMLILILFINIICANIHDKALKVSVISFYLILFLVISTLYQPGAIIHLVFINIIMSSIYYKDVKVSNVNSFIV